MIVVHHLENSRSQRVLWLLEELGLPYEVRRYERDRKTMLAPPELRRVHPLGKSPVIEDPDRGPGRATAGCSPKPGRSSNIWSRRPTVGWGRRRSARTGFATAISSIMPKAR